MFETFSGVDTATGTSAWDWQGKGWLAIATSQCEILCYEVVAEEAGGPRQ